MLNVLSRHAMLLKLYQGKCDQLAKATANTLRYRILKLEAEAILAEITVTK